MNLLKIILTMFLALGAWCPAMGATVSNSDTLHHELQVDLLPQQGIIRVADRLHLPPVVKEGALFHLNAGFTLEENAAVERVAEDGRYAIYRLRQRPADAVLSLNYEGAVVTGIRQGDHGMPLAVLDDQGAFFDGASAWFPRFGDSLQSFVLAVAAPEGWQVISQGSRRDSGGRIIHAIEVPQDDIYLVAGPYQRYAQGFGQVAGEVYLRHADDVLANDYLDAIALYLRRYAELLGGYPYSKFAVVENRWQTGYGMPSFTLLGSSVLRLPFILHTSLPHEILHNWWGNGVFVDYRQGNWSEGLTAYLADHLQKELEGEGASYRRQTLERYADFAAEGRDIPLREFTSRHNDATQAVGYGKSLMLFHMLRRELGDERFLEALRGFWRKYLFRDADFSALLDEMARAGGKSLDEFFRQWLERRGAPKLRLREAEVEAQEDGFDLRMVIDQIQAEAPFHLTLPVMVTLEGQVSSEQRTVPVSERENRITLRFTHRPLRVDLDPEFDVFRQLLSLERPNALGRLFGTSEQVLVLPSAVMPDQLRAWQRLASLWQARYGNVKVVSDYELAALPDDKPVWILGWSNSWRDAAAERLEGAGQRLRADRALIDGKTYWAGQHAVVLLDADNSRPALGFIGAGGAEVIDGMAGKLTHYGRYGRLVFSLPEIRNHLRQVLEPSHSPLSRCLANPCPARRVSRDTPLGARQGS